MLSSIGNNTMHTEILEALFIVIPFVSVPFLMFVWER
jgi:hypothetical protein